MPSDVTVQPQTYGRVAAGLHWFIALCVLLAVALGLTIQELGRGEAKDTVTTLHKSVGLTIFLLTALRLGWRVSHRAPPLPEGLPPWMSIGARANHVLLYALTFGMPVSGYVSVAARARETTLFWLIDIPRWVPLDRGLSRTAESLHANAQYILYALLAGHVGAALYHHFILKDDLLRRMWPRHR